MLEIKVKDPTKVKAGQIGALKRWGPEPARTVKLDDFPEDERRAILAAIAARRAARAATQKAAAEDHQTPATAPEVRRASVEHSAA